MICARYTEFRRLFNPTGLTAADGLPAWPGPVLDDGTIENASVTSFIRANGFSGTLRASTVEGMDFPITTIGPLVDPSRVQVDDLVFPLDITCAAWAPDAVPGVHEYDWYVSQRGDPGRYLPIGGSALVDHAPLALTVNHVLAGYSSVITIGLGAGVATLLPGLSGAGLTTASAWTTLFRHVHVYCRRRSDGAVQWARLYAD